MSGRQAEPCLPPGPGHASRRFCAMARSSPRSTRRRLDKGPSRHSTGKQRQPRPQTATGNLDCQKKNTNASKTGTCPHDWGQHPAPAQNHTRPNARRRSGLLPRPEAPRWGIGLSRNGERRRLPAGSAAAGGRGDRRY